MVEAAVVSTAAHEPGGDRDADFALGLERILDRIELLVAQRADSRR